MADYAAELLPHLARAAAVVLLEPPGWQAPGAAAWLDGVERLPHAADAPPGAVSVLHLGNNPYHVWIARRLRATGGVVVLHDTVLHHLLVEEAAADGAWERFGEEMAQAHGASGAALAVARRWGYSGRLDPFLFPARSPLLRRASGVIVHNRQAEADVAHACPGVPVRRVPLAVGALPAGDRTAWRARLGVGEAELLLVHLGFLTPAKGLDVILRSVAALTRLGVPVRLTVVGEGGEANALAATVAAAGLSERVRSWGYASEEDLGGIVAAADLGLVPRYPTAGETSAAALRFLAAGTPVAVAGYRQFLEFPAAAAPRIAPGRAGVGDLVRVAAALARDPSARSASRNAARQAWVDGGHEPRLAAAALLTAAGELAGEV
ncbi:MAG: glycosyltransferase [Thermoanaerobaculaceae bacterium]|nr:glycosyltransferase [Thermoanaerobaculaceae bacterium]